MPHVIGRRRAFAVLTSLVLMGIAACSDKPARKPSRPPSSRRPRPTKQAARLPPPFELPKQPPLLVHLARPNEVFARYGNWLGQRERPELVLARAFGRQVHRDFAERLAIAIAPHLPWTVVHLADRTEIWYLPLQPNREAQVRQSLQNLPIEGNFGARRLPAPVPAGHRGSAPAGRYLAWIDPSAPHALALSTSARGLVTAIDLPAVYGDHDVRVVGNDRLVQEILLLDLDGTLEHLDARGSVSRIEGDLSFRKLGGHDPLLGLPIAAGTLGRLLNHPHAALALSTRYTEHKQAVDRVLAQVRREVDNLPMLVQGIGQELTRKLKTVLQEWEGRTLVSTGPRGHLRAAFGVNNSANCERALNDLVLTLDGNLEMASSFVEGLPAIARQGQQKVHGFTISRLKVRKIKGQVPRELHGALNADGTINLAYAALASERAMLVTVGERAADELALWLSAYQEGGESHANDLLVASCAVNPTALLSLSDAQAALPRLLTLEAQGGQPRTTLAVQRRPGVGAFHFSLGVG